MDLQGFSIGKEFFPRELALVSDDVKICVEIDSKISKDFKIKNFRSLSFQHHQIHGIPVDRVIKEKCFQVIQSEDFKTFLVQIYYRIRGAEKNLIAIKNQQLAKILTECSIPFFDLEKEKICQEVCPPLHRFDKYNYHNNNFCLLHFLCSSYNTKVRCSLRKVAYIWDWINDRVKTERLLKDIIEIITETASKE